MKPHFTACLFLSLIFCKLTIAQDIKDILKQKPSSSIGFIRNNGQVLNSDSKLAKEVLFTSVHLTPKCFFQNNQFTLAFKKSKTGEQTAFDSLFRIDISWKWSDIGNVSNPVQTDFTEETFNYLLLTSLL